MAIAIAHYTTEDCARRVAEPDKPDSPRTVFARDRARVLHSWALRRLADKTQVLLPGSSDFPRTRLTHTLEVAQIAREMGYELGCDPDLVDTAGLCHDLGHPPFGHNGEDALNSAAADIGGFEGNAQSLRVLTRLETKVMHDGDTFGLNLSRASLDAAIKYPWPRSEGVQKFNYYSDDAPAFEWIRLGAPTRRRCLEAQVMDWADDVAYSVHDIEDALYTNLITPEQLHPKHSVEVVVEVAMRDYAGTLDSADIHAAFVRLQHLPQWPTTFDGSSGSLAALKQSTSALIGRFCQAAVAATRQRYGPHPLRRYDADLIVPDAARAEVAVLKSLSNHFVFFREGAEDRYAEQRALLIDLVEHLDAREGRDLAPIFAQAWATATDDSQRRRAVIDQVASLTDVSAQRWHRRLVEGSA
jgi:dGTPase